ncbi:G protein-regulated inducer of neurite outgrowth 1 [Ambystoma mexicanum]|uniref:G protein-regulated inducer of neurite outgrowth 1 n=1 Tax=Ambystoma mexicanum TaxID=8296 RepID=UPI0037E8E48B
MRTCGLGDYSIKTSISTVKEVLGTPRQKGKSSKMDRGPPGIFPVATVTTMITGKTTTAIERAEKSINLNVKETDKAKKQDSSRNGKWTGHTFEGSLASEPVGACADISTQGEHTKDASKDITSQQCLTKASMKGSNKELVSPEMSPVPSISPLTLIGQCPKNQEVEKAQPRSEASQVFLPMETKTVGAQATTVFYKKQSQVEVQQDKDEDRRHEAKLGYVIRSSSKESLSDCSTLPLAVCASFEDTAGVFHVMDMSSKQPEILTTAKGCCEEEKLSSKHLDPQNVCCLDQGGTSDQEIINQTSSCAMDEVNVTNQDECAGRNRVKPSGTPTKTCLPILNPPQHNVETQAGSRVECKSVAISPIVLPGGSSSFTFPIHTGKRAPSSPKGSPKGPPGKKMARTVDTVLKTNSFELTPPQHEVGIQAGIRAECRSIANSPIVPPDGSPSFSFQTGNVGMWSPAMKDHPVGKETTSGDTVSTVYLFKLTSSQQDAETQADTRAQCKSAAVSPIIPQGVSSSFPFQLENEKQESTLQGSSLKEHQTGGVKGGPLDTLLKTSSFELMLPGLDFGSQVDTTVECKSVAISPIILPSEGLSPFTFQPDKDSHCSMQTSSSKGEARSTAIITVDNSSKVGLFEHKPLQQDAKTQADTRVECKSIAISPIIPPDKTLSFSFQAHKGNQGSPCRKSVLKGQTEEEGASTVSVSKIYPFELTPPQQDTGTQADTKAECKSVAVSPIILPDGSTTFTFQAKKKNLESPSLKEPLSEDATIEKKTRIKDTPLKTCSFEITPPQQDVKGQADTRVECKSVAVSPIILPDQSFKFQEEKTCQPLSPKSSSSEVQATGKETLSEACSFEVICTQQDVSTQAGTRVECKSAAVSPIITSGETSSFPFTTDRSPSGSSFQGRSFMNQGRKEETRNMSTLCKGFSFEVTPPQQDVGTQAGTRVECKSAAVSPIIPPGETSSFPFSTDGSRLGSLSQGGSTMHQGREEQTKDMSTLCKGFSFEVTPPQQGVGTQAGARVECKSAAVSPIIPPGETSSFPFSKDETPLGSSSQGGSTMHQGREEQTRDMSTLCKGFSFEVTPPQQDVGTQAGVRVECKSAAVSPIIPPGETSSFPFSTDGTRLGSLSRGGSTVHQGREEQTRDMSTLCKGLSFEVTPPQQDVSTQAGTKVECKSAAVSPIIPPGETSSFPFLTNRMPNESSSLKSSSGDQDRGGKARSLDTLSKGFSFEITPPQQDVGVQVDTLMHCVHMAVSPIIPPNGSTSFTFQSVRGDQGPQVTNVKSGQIPSRRDAEMQVFISVATRSVATGPMTPTGKSPRTSYPEVRVKGAKGEQSEPVREVSWDEKGMTWEVYGASMEVEVLGMAIQKHLEKQIEEHGRQKVMTPQNTRPSSIRGVPAKGDVKRPPSIFRALLNNMRRPRCCSRTGPTTE